LKLTIRPEYKKVSDMNPDSTYCTS